MVILTLFTLIVTIGCQARNTPPANEAAPPNEKIEKKERVPQTARNPKRDQDPTETAHRLAKVVTHLPQVNDATVIIFGDYAIVGIDIDATLDRSRAGTIKYTVAEALKDDPMGAKALVTSDPDLLQRLKDLNADIQKGHPIKGFAEELSDIVARIIPQAPQAVPRREEPPTKENQQKLNQTKDPKAPNRDLKQQ